MGQVFNSQLNIGALTKQSSTVVQLAQSTLVLGGRQYTGAASLDITTNGFNGLDLGVLQPLKSYNLFAIDNNGSLGLIASLNATPTGFTTFTKIGAFGTDASSNIIAASKVEIGVCGDIKKSRLTEAQFVAENGAGWVLYDGRDITNSKLATLIGSNILEDARGMFLRAKNNGRVDGNENPDGDLAIGTFQGDGFGGHAHATSTESRNSAGGFINLAGTIRNAGISTSGTFRQVSTNTVGGNETRSKNITVNIFIKIN